jgi:hypothetical protein
MITLYRWNKPSKESRHQKFYTDGRAMNLGVPLFHFTSSHWLYRHAIITCANMQGKPSLSEILVSFPLCRESHEQSWNRQPLFIHLQSQEEEINFLITLMHLGTSVWKSTLILSFHPLDLISDRFPKCFFFRIHPKFIYVISITLQYEITDLWNFSLCNILHSIFIHRPGFQYCP